MNTSPSEQPRLKELQSQTEYALGETTIIGRHEDCNLILKSERGASRKHARITMENGAAILMDLGSLNGTTVNGTEISRAVQLVDGDVLVFDEQEYLYQAPNLANASNSDNITVIANKDEIGRPDRIKPAIRMVETPPPSMDDTDTSDAPAVAQVQAQSNEVPAYTGNTAIPATSRPGGNAPTPQRLQKRQEQQRQQQINEQYGYQPTPKKSRWQLWAIVVPLLIFAMLIAFYFAYNAGLSAANTTSTVIESQ